MISEILSKVDIPKPEAPSSEDVVDWGDKVSGWLTDMSPTTMKLLVVGVAAALIAAALRRSPFLKGAVIATIVVGIILVAFL